MRLAHAAAKIATAVVLLTNVQEAQAEDLTAQGANSETEFTDESLRVAVKDQLWHDRAVPHNSIEVTVTDGIVEPARECR